MGGAPTLLSGRITRRAMAWLVVAVLVVTPIEGIAYDHPVVLATVPLRAGLLVMILWGLLSYRISAIVGGRLFLAQGVVTMLCWSILVDSNPGRVAMEAVAYGTILPVFTLLIAPKPTRRSWALLVLCVVLYPAIVRLMPDHLALLVQVVTALAVHSASIAALDSHANKAELAGEMAGIDPLTGLLNRRSAITRLNRSVDDAAVGRRSSLILLDLDHFKQLNDTLGHEAGDDALQQVARVLRAFVRPVDSVCRWGGEEFLVLLPDAGEALAAATAEFLRAGLVEAGVTASFGVAEIAADDTVTSWVRRADDAMYAAKHGGRNAVCVAPPLPKSSAERR